MFNRFPKYRAVRVVPFAGLAVLALMVAAANGCGGGSNDRGNAVIFVSPSPRGTGIPGPPLDDALFLPASPGVAPRPSSFATPSPIPSPPSLGGF